MSVLQGSGSGSGIGGKRYSLKVPFLNAWKDLVVGEVEAVFVLPEGAQ